MNTNKEKNFISIVIYVYNDEKKIFDFLKKIDSIFTEKFDKYEFICVNDASHDSSVNEIRRFSKQSQGIFTVLNMSFYQGLELSMNAGVDLAIGDFVYEFESTDITYPIELLWQVYNKALEGFDIVAASPETDRNYVSGLFYRIFNKNAHIQYPLQTEAFTIVSRRLINRVKSMSKTIPYRKAIYANCGLKKATIVYKLQTSMPKIRRSQQKDYRNTAIDAIILYTDLAFQWSIVFSALMMASMLVTALYTLIIYFRGIPIAGWSSTILFLSFTLFGVFAVLTIAIKYLSVILKLNFSCLTYVIESIEKVK